MANVWREFWGEWCEKCDGQIFIFTDSNLRDGFGFSGDSVKCYKCGRTGKFTIGKKGWNVIVWDRKLLERILYFINPKRWL